MKRVSCSPQGNSVNSVDVYSLESASNHRLSKRIRLSTFSLSHAQGHNLYERIFRMADHFRRSLYKEKTLQATRSSSAGNDNRRCLSLKQLIPPASHPIQGNSSTSVHTAILSSTPFTKLPDKKSSFMRSERCLYQRLLAQATAEPPHNRFRDPSFEMPVTIVVDDSDTVPASSDPSVFRKCKLSPIRSLGKACKPTGRSDVEGQPELNGAATATLAKLGPDHTDEQARAWLRTCEQTPYLSDQWLANLTSTYQAKAKQRARERQLLECKVHHYEKQRGMAYQQRMNSLEQRLACLSLTPPVLNDPYLVPQPIPIELPYQPRKVASIAPSLPELNESQLSEIEVALRTGPLDKVVVEAFNLCVTRKELTTLGGLNWLSDVVINFYLQLLCKRSQQQQQSSASLPRLAVMNTFFYTKLTSGTGYAGVRRWSRLLNLLDQDLVFIPIHDRGMHWCLACIDFNAKSITYYDSMGSPNNKCLHTLKSYLQSECEDKKGHPLPDPDSWKLVNTEDTVPQQENGSDCGVFLCTFGEFLSRRAPFTFTQSDMPGIRKRMIFEIITRQLLTTGFKMT